MVGEERGKQYQQLGREKVGGFGPYYTH